MNTDLTFITNEKNENLSERFKVLIKDTKFFDVLVGYFYTSGFYAIYKSLENTEKLRILIGISTNRDTYNLIQKSYIPVQESLQFSHAEAKEKFSDTLVEEMGTSEDNYDTEEGVNKFLEWLKSGKLEIKAYPSENIHAKLYIMTFAEDDRDVGRVITGSSNFTRSGLIDNLEFNVELKTRADYEFAKLKFNNLWKNAVDVSEKYIETIQTKTWLNNTITPYDLYLKFLYEYFKDEISRTSEVFYKYVPAEFKKLEYQEQAVLNAKKILEEYGGVFIADVVGLGKTYISAMLAQQLDGRSLVIASPVLLEENNPGSWRSIFRDFNVPATFKSIGKLDHLVKQGVEGYKNVFIDEAHHFRTETNITYEALAKICRGKRVILVSATPLNNSPKDILSQVKLFQKGRKSTIPNLPDLERFFAGLEKRLKGLDRQTNHTEYMNAVRDNAKDIREKLLKYLMVRRTRSEIVNYFGEDLKRQKLKFPEVANPEPIFYELNDEENEIFNSTIELITKKFNYVRYTPMLYYQGKLLTQPEELAQKNMGKFMKILLVKRLESSFYAFKNTLHRFISSYEQFIKEFENGNVYVSKKYTNKIFEFLENDNDEAIQRLIDEEKANCYPSRDFTKEFKERLENDLCILREVSKLWENIKRDPKLLKFIEVLSSRAILKDNKIIIFTESKETAEYLGQSLQSKFPNEVLTFWGGSSTQSREKVIENFDARARFPKNDYRILISTEVLSEGVNLHRSNVVVNYDIPWNPTRLMQRTGRINRVDTTFDTIYTFNFFPTKQSNDQIKLKEAAEAKIHAFIEMLGNDARLLTEGEEIKSHDLWVKLTSKKTITGEDEGEESELKYLQIIRNIRDKEPDVFERVKRLPKKARTAKGYTSKTDSLLTYFRKGKLHKFYLANNNSSEELDFISAAKTLEVEKDTKRENIGKDYYPLLEENKKAFEFATLEEVIETKSRGGRDSATQVLRILKSTEIKHFKGFTDEDERYIRKVIKLLEEGGLPRQTTKTLIKQMSEHVKGGINPLRRLAILKTTIAPEFFRETIVESSAQTYGPREVILSEYLISK
ncbi:phospholipase D-like domain-containing protein [Candidatus Parcubacteria bacterium]|nr:phospholipase D-like domain-containing protein [Candidatus Parcubacteria bacterium]